MSSNISMWVVIEVHSHEGGRLKKVHSQISLDLSNWRKDLKKILCLCSPCTDISLVMGNAVGQGYCYSRCTDLRVNWYRNDLKQVGGHLSTVCKLHLSKLGLWCMQRVPESMPWRNRGTTVQTCTYWRNIYLSYLRFDCEKRCNSFYSF